MNEWIKYPLGGILEIIGGGTPKTSIQEYWGGDIPWLSVVDFNTGLKFVNFTEKSITQKGLENSSTKLLNKGDIIISARGTVGVLAVLARPMTFNQSCYGIRCKQNLSDTDYLYYLLTNTVRELTQISHGGVFDTITRATFDEIEIDLPPVPEQKAIASVLSSLDDKIDLLHRQNKTLEAMAETLFRQWFIEDESLDEVSVSELIGFNPKRTLAKGTESTYLEMAGLSTQSFNATGYYKREFTSGTKFIHQDTLLARITPCLENGKAGYVTFLSDKEVGWGSTEYIVMRPKSGIHPLMAYVLCRNQDFKDYAESCMEGSSGRQRVNVDHLQEFTIGKPTDEVIQQFNEYLESIESKLIYNSKQIQTLEQLRDTLLPKLMNGEVRVMY